MSPSEVAASSGEPLNMSESDSSSSDLIFEAQDFIARFVKAGGEDICFITFHSFTDDPRLERPGFGESFLRKLGIDAVHVINRTNQWYLYEETPRALEAIRQRLSNYRKRITYGSSMGGYAAIRFAEALGVETAIAISPQYSISRKIGPYDKRWRQLAKRVKRIADETPHGSSKVRPIVFFDPYDFDSEHFRWIAEAYPLAQGMPLPHTGHPSGAFLSETGLLRPVILATFRDYLDSQALLIAAKQRRRKSGQYLFTLARRLAPWHGPWKLDLARAAIGAHDDAAYRIFLALLQEKRGDVQRAEEQLLAAQSLLPEHPVPLKHLATDLLRHGRYHDALSYARRLHDLAPERAINALVLAAALIGVGDGGALDKLLLGRRTIKRRGEILENFDWPSTCVIQSARVATLLLGKSPFPRLASFLSRSASLKEEFSHWDEWRKPKRRGWRGIAIDWICQTLRKKKPSPSSTNGRAWTRRAAAVADKLSAIASALS